MRAPHNTQLLGGLLILALLAATSACGGEDDRAAAKATRAPTTQPATTPQPAPSESTAATSVAPSTSAPARPDRLPDGRYERVITRAEAEGLGIDPAIAAEMDQVHAVIELEGDRFRVLVGTNPNRLEIGDEGSSAYDDQGNWVMTSESIGCPGCVAVLRWTLDGDSLQVSATPPDDDPFALVLLNGSYTRASTAAAALTMTGFLDFVPPQIVTFLDAVDAADPPLEISTDLTIGYRISEAELLDAVAAGEVDIAFLGARTFPRFEPLLAPFLIDSYELQQEVFDDGIPQAMLTELGVPGVVGIAVTPGPFRKIMGVDRTVDEARDLAGARVNTDDTELAEATFAALGATAVPGGAIDEVDAFAIQLQAIPGNGYEDDAASITANLNTWPRPLVIVINADAYSALTPAQRQVLGEAAADATRAAIAASQAEDEEALGWICPSPMQIVEMPVSELDALRTMVEPVYADLRQDTVLAAELAAIERLKDSITAPPDTFSCD